MRDLALWFSGFGACLGAVFFKADIMLASWLCAAISAGLLILAVEVEDRS